MTNPRFLLLPDVPDWAFDVNLRDMAEYVPDFDFVFHYMKDGAPPDSLFDSCEAGAYLPWHAQFKHRPELMARLHSSLRAQSLWPAEKPHVTAEDAEYVNGFRAFHVVTRRAYDALKPHCPRLSFLTNPVNMRKFPRASGLGRDVVFSWNGRAGHTCLGARDLDVKGFRSFIEPAMKATGAPLVVADYDKSRIAHKDMPAWYRQANVTLSASLYEGASNSIMEAMASGHAIIGTPVGNLPEIQACQLERFGVTGILLLRERSVEAITEAVERLRHEPARVAQMGEINRAEIAARWSWEVWADHYAQFLGAIQ